jgi:hypothetical protein
MASIPNIVAIRLTSVRHRTYEDMAVQSTDFHTGSAPVFNGEEALFTAQTGRLHSKPEYAQRRGYFYD